MDKVKRFNTVDEAENFLKELAIPLTTGSTRHTVGIREIAQRIDVISNALVALDVGGAIEQLYKAIDGIHGVGPTLRAKLVFYFIRCFGIGYQKIDTNLLKSFSLDLAKEAWLASRLEVLQRNGIQTTTLIEELTKLGDPFAIDLLYDIDDEELLIFWLTYGSFSGGQHRNE
ncbi:MAG TPA: hypothetical protein VFF30_16825 [Nitrososphaerales archaeon]|nr:hypothetical protein [Nitrososphaerales archaeon]